MNKFFRIFAKTANIWRGLLTAFVALLLVAFFLTQFAFANKIAINSYLGLVSSKAVQTGNAEVASHYKSEFAADVKNPTQEEFEALKDATKKQAVSEMEEGAVLLRNNDVNGAPALPLAKGAKVSLFGHASEDPMYKPFSGGAMGGSNNVRTGMEAAGFKINEKLYDAYASARSNGDFGGGTRHENLGESDWRLYEVNKDFYDQPGIRDSYAQYGDAAIVYIARTGGEDRDLPTAREGLDATGFTVDDPSLKYLELQTNERDMLSEIKKYKDEGVFDKVIAVINTGNAMELGWLDEYDVDACLWVGGYGNYGVYGMANILCGDVNPSGRLADTYAYNSLSSPAMTNFGSFTYTNASQMLTRENGVTDIYDHTSHYVVHAEGIYVGYKYYETRYEDVVLGNGDADSDVGSSTEGNWKYSDEVQYPFGYGLSYTDFSLEIVEEECSYDPDKVGEEFTIAVKVTNTGDVAGKRSVQLYMQVPYIEYGVEKPAIRLVNFGKTDMLYPEDEAGENKPNSQTLTITVDKYFLASYDYQGLNDDGVTGYILDSGNYYFAVGDSVHDALNYILAKKGASGMVNVDGSVFSPDSLNMVWTWELEEPDTETYHYSRWNEGVEVTNRLEEADLNHWIEDGVTYLTRADWSGTFPEEATQITLTAEMAREIGGNYYEDLIPENAPAVSDFTQGAKNGIPFVSMHGVDYDDDEMWNTFLDQLTVEEMLTVTHENWGTGEVKSVNKPYHRNDDGPDGMGGGYKVYKIDGEQIDYINGNCMMYPNEIVLVATYNYDLIKRRGELLGEESMFATTPQMWSPGANFHRTPYGGRNFEYYSEDPNLGYLCAGTEVAAMRSKGVVTAIKHFVGNNQETNRRGLATFVNEQTFRENDMRVFEGAFTIGKSNSTMTAFNRVGMRAFAQHDALQNEILRGEWGFKGVIISDGCTTFMHPRESLIAGNDMWCLSGDGSHINPVREAINNGDGFMLQALREANKHFYYAYCNSHLTNGLSTDTIIVDVTNWWETALNTVDTVLLVITIIVAVLFIASAIIKAIVSCKDKDAAVAEEADHV